MHVFMHPACLCLLVGAFNPFTFKVIYDLYTASLVVQMVTNLPAFHIYVLVYCNGLYLSGLLHSV